MSARITFVSSGPGDPELLTLKAVACLQSADVVLFDHLSRPALVHARAGATLIDVGKRAGRPSARQDDIIALLLAHARTGARIVRLKSGDAGIFGRLEEEAQALDAAGLAFSIIPGVSAASAAAAAAGIPLTRRNRARRVQFFTGHDIRGALPDEVNLVALADAEALSVIYMARGTFPALARLLIAAGLSPETPAMLAEAVSTIDEAISRFTVATLAVHLATGGENSELPTLIVYGPLAETGTFGRLAGRGTAALPREPA